MSATITDADKIYNAAYLARLLGKQGELDITLVTKFPEKWRAMFSPRNGDRIWVEAASWVNAIEAIYDKHIAGAK
jgi:hypothetical protein